MARWEEIEAQAPDLAGRARVLFDAHVHKALATLRRDGSPRISGSEIIFAEGEIWFGSMWRAVKALDLRRDPRFALHSGSIDPPDWAGDAKIAGRAVEVEDAEVVARVVSQAPPGPMHLFRADIDELSVVRLGDPADHLVIESWHPGRGVERLTRA
jgi:Pyridoxamine 5'-phosphate oxidase